MEILSHSLEETSKIADDFLTKLKAEKDSAPVIALSGDLGSGKTAFVQACAKLMGIDGNITSPTFVIMKKYFIPSTPERYPLSAICSLVHIDAYRLKSGDELLKLNIKEIFADPSSLVFLEWPENVSTALPKDVAQIYFEFVDEKTRKINFV